MMDPIHTLFDVLPEPPAFKPGIRRAPRRESHLSDQDKRQALKNALRYLPEKHHAVMAPEFLQELETRGRIYGYRFMPKEPLKGLPIDQYQGQCTEGQAIQVMLDNNLDHAVALYPYELVTYGETGQVCQNWMQYHLIKHYLQRLTREQTLVLMSGHPLGLFRSHEMAPRLLITNGLMIGQFDNPAQFSRATALGVANYGQMTAGGMMYIGPQGIVHGTFNTLLGAGAAELGIPRREPGRQALCLLRPGRHERRPGQGSGDCRGRLHHRGGGPFPHRDPPQPGLGHRRDGQP